MGSIVECSITIQAQKMNSATLRLFSLAEQCHTQNSYLRCFMSDFYAVKSKFDVRGIAHARTDREDDIFMQRQLYIDEAHTALDIFPIAPPI